MVEQKEEDEEARISIKNLLDGKEYTVPKKKIYANRPHITADNHFSGDNFMELERMGLALQLPAAVIVSLRD
jgi:hypothetical protein